MALDYYDKVWHNGEFIPWDSATIPVASHVVSYASCIFEGIRCYDTVQGPAIFRLKEHTERLINSCRIYRMEPKYTEAQLEEAMLELMRVNRCPHAYIRPVVFRGYGDMGVNPLNNPIEVYLMCWNWGEYMGHAALADGIDVCVSSWNRVAQNTFPAGAKSAANYMNSQLIKMEAVINGFAEGIALDANGYVSEASGANIFLIKDGKLKTPPLGSAVLPGITRDSVMILAEDLGYSVKEELISREMLYIADEVFFTGTAAELTPLRSIDRIPVGNGKPGAITRKLQQHFLDIAHGRAEDKYGWLTYCNQPVAAGR